MNLQWPTRKGSGLTAAARRRRTNQALFVLVPFVVLTGLFSNTIGIDWWIDPAAVHGVAAVALAFLTPWKAPIVQRGLGRRRPGRSTSLILLILIVVAMSSGLIHAADVTDRVGPLTIMQVHVGSALLALVLVAFHYRSHPVPVHTTDLDRRAFLSAASVGLAATLLRAGWEGALGLLSSPGADRRFTGSHERASFQPDAMPVTSWFNDRVPHIEATDWSVTVDGRALTLADLETYPTEELTAVLDCTSGWYSQQNWTGVRLDQLVQTDKAAIAIVSATGYRRRFPARDLEKLWLAVGVGGSPLSAGHGYPARIVAPGRRGFWWVKWVTEITPTDVPAWLQLPFPAS